jgi:hypothetical protein
MSAGRLEDLGLVTRDTDAGVEAELSLTATLVNPLTRQAIDRVQFMVVGDRLLAISPPELVGLPPVGLGGLGSAADLEAAIRGAFDTHILHLQRRSAELQELGIPAHVHPETLELTAQLEHPPLLFVLLADKQGQFRVAQVFREGTEVQVPTGQPFELSEFRERSALGGYLGELFAQATGEPAGLHARPPGEPLIYFAEVSERFGRGARLPPRSALELLVEMRAGGVRYRFAAARLAGRSFRGLLAGPAGKVWAERFELEDFPGPEALLAHALDIPIESVEVLPTGHEG